MIPAGTRIWIVAGVTDLRRGFVGLSAQVQTALEENPFSGQVFVFRGRRGDLVKLLWFDGDGLCLFAKRLERGRFEVEHLKLLLAKLRRMQFGRRSEKIARQIEQLELRLEDLESKRAEAAAPAETQTAAGAEEPNLLIGAKPARRPLPAHLPRRTNQYEPAESAWSGLRGARCGCSGKMFPRCWSMCRPSSR